MTSKHFEQNKNALGKKIAKEAEQQKEKAQEDIKANLGTNDEDITLAKKIAIQLWLLVSTYDN